MVLQERQACDRDQQELEAEGVVLAVECLPESHVDHVHSDIGTQQKNDLGEGREVARLCLQLLKEREALPNSRLLNPALVGPCQSKVVVSAFSAVSCGLISAAGNLVLN